MPVFVPTVALIVQLSMRLLLLPPATDEEPKSITPLLELVNASALVYLILLLEAPLAKVKAVPVVPAVLVFLNNRYVPLPPLLPSIATLSAPSKRIKPLDTLPEMVLTVAASGWMVSV